MLVVMRRAGERLVIDSRIEVTILEVRGNRVRVGIRAPREVPVHRGEVQDAIEEDDELGPPRQAVLQAQAA